MFNIGVVGDRGVGETSASAMMWNRNSEYSGVGTVRVPKSGSSLSARLGSLIGSKKSPQSGIHDDSIDKAAGSDLEDKPKAPWWHGKGQTSSARQAISYYEAPLSEYYGFGKETAYQEALANTAYRREVNDMQKAGLNPSVIYGAHNTSGADTSIIPRSSSGGGGGGRRSYGKAAQKGISKTAYYGIQLAATGLGAMLGGRGGAFVGATVGRTAAQLLGALKGK